MNHSIDIRAASDNPEATMHLVFGQKVSRERILNCIGENVEMKLKYGLISDTEANEILKDANDKINALK